MPVTINEKDRKEVIRLLGDLQDHLESVIDCHTVPGTGKVSRTSDAAIVATARRKWRRVEDMVKKLEAVEQEDTERRCESGCIDPVAGTDCDGVPLCAACIASLIAEDAAKPPNLAQRPVGDVLLYDESDMWPDAPAAQPAKDGVSIRKLGGDCWEWSRKPAKEGRE